MTKQSTFVLSKKFVESTPRPWLSPLRRRLFRRSSSSSNNKADKPKVEQRFYQRLLTALSTRHDNNTESNSTSRLVVVSPDLLGSGSACNPTTTMSSDGQELQHYNKLPLLNISDWTDQIVDLMAKTEKSANIDRWCIVANGGCSPIALQVAQRSVEGTVSFHKKVS